MKTTTIIIIVMAVVAIMFVVWLLLAAMKTNRELDERLDDLVNERHIYPKK